MKAIETSYKGYRMRSRLEARWAVFFDALDIQWEYEAEGFELETTRYLPDFWLPNQQIWFEVKGQELSEYEERKCKQFASVMPLFVSVGNIPIPEEDNCNVIYKYTGSDKSGGYQWAECPFCNTLGITFAGTFTELPCRCCHKGMNMPWISNAFQQLHEIGESGKAGFVAKRLMYWGDTPNLMTAYIAARQARFEFGEEK